MELTPKTGSQDKLLFLSPSLGFLRIKRLCQNPGKSPLRAVEGAGMPWHSTGTSVMFGQLQLDVGRVKSPEPDLELPLLGQRDPGWVWGWQMCLVASAPRCPLSPGL